MAFGVFTIHAGPFKNGQALPSGLRMIVPGRFFAERIPYAQISELELATEENMNRLAGALGLGLVGDLALGPIGLLAGLIRGGRGRQFTFVCILRDGRRFLATAKEPIWARLNRELAVSRFNSAESASSPSSSLSKERGELGHHPLNAQPAGHGWRTLLRMLCWTMFFLFAVTGIATISLSPLAGLGFLGLALMTFPLLNTILEKHFEFQLSLWIRGAASIGFIILIGSLSPH